MFVRSFERFGRPLSRLYTSESLVYKSHGNPEDVLSVQQTDVPAPSAAQVLVDFLAVSYYRFTQSDV